MGKTIVTSSRLVFAGDKGRGEPGLIADGLRCHFGRMEIFWNQIILMVKQ